MTAGSEPTRNTMQTIRAALAPHGLVTRGIAQFDPAEGATPGPALPDGSRAASVVLIGHIGGAHWPAFCKWRAQQHDRGGADPLDRWSKQILMALARAMGAAAWFPSDPPWQPFQQWAMQAERLRPSPLGILIHPEYGLWHGYRGALGFQQRQGTTHRPARTHHPCDSCPDKPCITACPAGAIGRQGFDVPACRDFLRSPQGAASCMWRGCLSRLACPVGAAHRYGPDQARFHMNALSL